MSTVLVVANETIGGRGLLQAVESRHAKDESTRFVLVVPQTKPRQGLVVYADAVYEAAQARVDLAVSFLRQEGIHAVGEVGDPDPYTATIDAVDEHRPSEVIVSTYPETRSGWLRRDLIGRIEAASGLPVEHIVSDIEAEGLPFRVTLVVANRTASADALLEHLRGKHDETDEREHLFVVVVPLEGGEGAAVRRARTRLQLTLTKLRDEGGLLCAGMVGDPDPYTATMNALQYFRVSDVVISTHPATRSGWLRADLIERVRRTTGLPVDHLVVEVEASGAAS